MGELLPSVGSYCRSFCWNILVELCLGYPSPQGCLSPGWAKVGRASAVSLTGSRKGSKAVPLPEDLSQKRHNGKSSQKTDSGPELHINLLYPKQVCCLVQLSPSSLSLFCSTSLLTGSFGRSFTHFSSIQLISFLLNAEPHVSLPNQLQGSRRPKGCPLRIFHWDRVACCSLAPGLFQGRGN